MDPWYWQRLMVWIWTYVIDNTHGVDLDSWYSIGTPESHKYEKAECCPFAGFFMTVSEPKIIGEKKNIYIYILHCQPVLSKSNYSYTEQLTSIYGSRQVTEKCNCQTPPNFL